MKDLIARDERHARGAETIEKVYAGKVPAPEPGSDRFMDLMLCGIFADLWDETIVDIPSRRLFTMGIIAGMGEAEVFGLQCRVALEKEELTAEQIRELVCHAAPYAGFPRSGGLRAAAEEAIRAVLGDAEASELAGGDLLAKEVR